MPELKSARPERRVLDPRNATALIAERDGATGFRDAFLIVMDKLVSMMAGPSYCNSAELSEFSSDYLPDNRFLEYVAQMVPAVAFQEPTFDVSTSMPRRQKDVARALMLGLDQWAIDERLKDLSRRIAVDQFLNWGVVRVAARPESDEVHLGDFAGIPWRPVAERIDQRNHFRDPLAVWIGTARYEGHDWIVDKDQLVAMAEEEDGWDVRAVKELTAGSDGYERPTASVHRNDVVLTDMWSPEFVAGGEREDGENGAIVTFALSGHYKDGMAGAQPLREPQAWIGHPRGPYVTFGVYDVPNMATPLGPLTAHHRQVVELNKVTRAIMRAELDYARFVVTSSKSLAERIASGLDSHVYHDADFQNESAQTFEKGGSTQQQHVARQWISDMVDRGMGRSEALRGMVSGRGTATENEIAAEAGSLAVSYVKERHRDGMSAVGERAAYLMYFRDDIVFAVRDVHGEVSSYEEPEDAIFRGGPDSQSPGSDAQYWRNLRISVRAGSMERQDQGMRQQNTVTALQLVAEAVPLALQGMGSPDFWVSWTARLGEAFNVEGLERLMLEALGGEQPPQPMLARDAGLFGQGARGRRGGAGSRLALGGGGGGRSGPGGAAGLLAALGGLQGAAGGAQPGATAGAGPAGPRALGPRRAG